MSEKHIGDYDDEYPTCVETYSTLRVFSNDIGPLEITELLQMKPTETFRKGDLYSGNRLQRKSNGWFYSTKNLCSSKDTRRHIDFILNALNGKFESVNSLRQKQCKIDITSYWVSLGQGGPWLMAEQMLKLGTLGIGVWWDVYFEEETQQDQTIK